MANYISFDPDRNVVEVSGLLGYLNVSIDGNFFSKTKFSHSVKIHFVLTPDKDVEVSSKLPFSNSHDNVETCSDFGLTVTSQELDWPAVVGKSDFKVETFSEVKPEITEDGHESNNISQASVYSSSLAFRENLSDTEDYDTETFDVNDATQNEEQEDDDSTGISYSKVESDLVNKQIHSSDNRGLQNSTETFDVNDATQIEEQEDDDSTGISYSKDRCDLVNKQKHSTNNGELQISTETFDLNDATQNKEQVDILSLRTSNSKIKKRSLEKAKHSKEHSCRYCKQTFTNIGYYDGHLKGRKRTLETCKICGIKYRGNAVLLRHEFQRHGITDVIENVDSLTAKCTLCGELVKHHNLAPHIRSRHSDEIYYKCCVCGLRYLTKDGVLEHCQLMHFVNGERDTHKKKGAQEGLSGSDDFNMDGNISRKLVQEVESSNVDNEKVEDEIKKKGKRKTSCDYCKANFTSYFSYNAHFRKMERSLVTCKHCGLELKGQSLLQIHEFIHHGISDVIKNVDIEFVKCTLCGKKVRRSSIAKHIRRTHTAEVIYKCCLCGLSYQTRKSLLQHYGQVHGKSGGVKLYKKKEKQVYWKSGEMMTDNNKVNIDNASNKEDNGIKMLEVNDSLQSKTTCPQPNFLDIAEHSQYSSLKKTEDIDVSSTFSDMTHKSQQEMVLMKEFYELEQDHNEDDSEQMNQETEHGQSVKTLVSKFATKKKFKDYNFPGFNADHSCKYCKVQFRNFWHYWKHIRGTNYSSATCQHCGLEVKGQSLLMIHEFEHHGIIDKFQIDNSKVLCSICGKKFERCNLARHVKYKHTDEICYKCCMCGLNFSTRSDMLQHCEEAHLEVADKKGKYHCSVCGEYFKTESEMNTHKPIHLRICIFCGEDCGLRPELVKHYNEKHPEKMLDCDHCDKKFPSSLTLQKHKKNYRFFPLSPCPVCGFMFRHMERHMKRCHPATDTRVPCPTCGKILINQSSLVSHEKRAHSNFVKMERQCHVCSMVLKNKMQLYRHLRQMHFSIKWYECKVCGKKTKTPYNLKVHMRIHSINKLFTCSVCDKGFNYRASLKSHIQSKHPECDLNQVLENNQTEINV